MKKDMIHGITKRLVRNGRTRVRQGAHCSSLTGVLRLFALLFLQIVGNIKSTSAWRNKDSQFGKQMFPVWETNVPNRGIYLSPKGHFLCVFLLLLVMMTVGTGKTWGQIDFSGTYYLGNSNGYSGTISNNFYLIPSEGCYYGGDLNTPHLTTYKSNHAGESLWRIEKTGNYYYIIQGEGESEKYLTANPAYDGTTGNNVGRLRVHLDSKTTGSEDPYLFMIVPNVNGGYNIKHKDMSDKINNSTTTYLDPAGGNVDNKNATSARTMSTTNGTVNVGGTIGYWTDEPAARWIFEDKITRPTIAYSGNNITITYPSSAEIYYTINGDDPTKQESTRQSFTGTSCSFEFTDNTMVKAAAKIGDEYSNITTLNACVHIGSTNKYLVQTIDGGSYYMVPPITTEANVTTTNIPHEKMAWYFEDAGQTHGIQFYYIRNSKTNDYLYCSGGKAADNAFKTNASVPSGTDANKYKFMIVASEEGYNVIPRNYMAETTGMCMSKKGGNNTTSYLNLSSGTDNYSRWKFISVPNNPKTQFDFSFASSSADNKYYKIQNANSSFNIIPPTTSGGNATAGNNAVGNNTMWYFVPTTDNDDWVEFYHVRNGLTGEYLYFTGNPGDPNTFYTSNSIITGNEDQYKFIVVKGADSNYPDAFNIIPKALKDQVNQANSSLNRNNTVLRTQNSRAVVASLWNLVADENYKVAPPYITYDVATNTVTLSSTYPGATIYFTTNGSEATISSTNTASPVDPNPTAYTSFVLGAGVNTIRAIVSKEGVGSSSESTYSIAFQLTLTDATADLRPYLIQSQSNAFFYMIPGDDVGEDPNKITKVNTTSLFRPTMEWYIRNAGIEDGVQYYYIANSNNKNLCYDTENTANGVYMDTNSDNSNKFKFQIKETSIGGTFNIIPYGVTTGNMYVCKYGGNSDNRALSLYDKATDANSRWKFVPSSDLDKTAPFDVPDASSTPYYKIASVGSSGYYIIPPAGAETNATTSNSTDAEVVKTMNWYFEVVQAATDADWCTYYFIRNVLTDEYLYFAKDDNDDGAWLEMKNTIETGEEDRYMFTWARTTETDKYYIVPKKVKDISLNQISGLQRDNGTLKSNLTRAAGNFAWTFNPSYFCLNPTISYIPGEETGTVNMTCDTRPSKIYYTTDGSDPASSNTRIEYDSENKPPFTDVAQIYIKAIAALDISEHEAVSDPITFIKNPTVTFSDEYDYEYNNLAKEPPVTSVTVGTDNTVINAAEYDVTYGTDVNVGPVSVTISDKDVNNNLIISGVASFDITPRSLGDGTTASDGIMITVTKTPAEGDTYTYSVSVKNGSLTLEEGTDYTLTDVTTDASGYRATVTAKVPGNYRGGAKIIYVAANFPTKTSLTDGGSAAVYQAGIDLANPTDLKAYIVTGVDYSSKAIDVQELAYIPKDVPVLLLTNEDLPHNADFTTSEYVVGEGEGADVTANLLRKSDGGELVDWGQYFIFSRGEFVLSMGEKTMKADKFYLVNEDYSSPSAPARLYIRRRSSSTKIKEVDSLDIEKSTTSIWYTLDGQKLSKKPTRKGIYINKGNKVVVR